MKSLRYLFRIGSGPSSSHTMAIERACELFLDKFQNADFFVVHLYGSLALTGKGHLTDYIVKQVFGENKCDIVFDFKKEITHPNTFKIESFINGELIASEEFVSVGGGALSIDSIQEEIYPFKNFLEIKTYCQKENISLADFVYRFEGEEIKKYLEEVYNVMVQAIKRGIEKTSELPGGLHVQRKASELYLKKEKENQSERERRLISCYAYAVSEENASGGKIVTAPTCGACGILPAVLYFMNKKGHKKRAIIDAIAVSSVFGNVIKQNASISGAYAGCQSEVGTACSMASAAICYLKGGNIDEIECASEIAMEHHLGLTCDPINGLVQIPCIERNAVAALRAFDSASLALLLASSRMISFDTVVKTMYQTGLDLSKEYKETSLGGLAKHYKKSKI